jgi:DNA-directed RNA polymerase subunit RPC12/RpoP
MNQQAKDHEDNYAVDCVWCGAKIREDNEEGTTGVCLKCFYQMLTNHLQSQRRTVYGEYVSDR